MSLGAISPSRSSLAVRFSGQPDRLFKLADGVLRELAVGPDELAPIINKRLGFLGINRFVNWVHKLLCDQDYTKLVPITFNGLKLGPLTIPKFNLGRIVVEPSLGTFSVISLGFIIGGRVYHAVKRAVNNDYREVRDILTRDILGMSMMMYGMPPVVWAISKWRQARRGIQLLGSHEALSYSDLSKTFQVTDPNRLNAILKQPNNHKGLLQALKEIRQAHYARHFDSEGRFYFDRLENAMNTAIAAKESQLRDAAVNRVVSYIQHLDKWRQGYTGSLAQFGKQPNQKMIDAVQELVSHKIPVFSDVFSNYAKRTRNWSSAVSFAIVIFGMGVAIPVFNQWFTEKEYKRVVLRDPARNPFASHHA